MVVVNLIEIVNQFNSLLIKNVMMHYKINVQQMEQNVYLLLHVMNIAIKNHV